MHDMQDVALSEATNRLLTATSGTDETQKRNAELLTRCNHLGTKLEAERKLRMVAQREAKLNSRSSSSSSSSGGGGGNSAGDGDGSSSSSGGGGDSGMLEMALSMLRCSVCRDRFKEVAITRCYHLFCRECIDTNLTNRHRKCPACGEKFGADDVKQVYFTH